MLKKTRVAVCAVVLLGFLLCGCETTKGIAEGVTKDSQNTWASLKKADDWMRKNLW